MSTRTTRAYSSIVHRVYVQLRLQNHVFTFTLWGPPILSSPLTLLDLLLPHQLRSSELNGADKRTHVGVQNSRVASACVCVDFRDLKDHYESYMASRLFPGSGSKKIVKEDLCSPVTVQCQMVRPYLIGINESKKAWNQLLDKKEIYKKVGRRLGNFFQQASTGLSHCRKYEAHAACGDLRKAKQYNDLSMSLVLWPKTMKQILNEPG